MRNKVDKMSQTKLSQEELRRLSAEYMLLQNLIRELEQRISLLSTTINELMTTKQTINELSKLSKDHELIVSVGRDVYLRVKVAESGKFLVDLGAGTVVERSTEDAIKIIDSRIEDLRKALEEHQRNYSVLVNRLAQIREIIEKST